MREALRAPSGNRNGLWKRYGSAKTRRARTATDQQVLVETHGGDYGWPGSRFEVVEVRVRRLGGRFSAEGLWLAGSNQGHPEEHQRREAVALARDPFEAVHALEERLAAVDAPRDLTVEACSRALRELAELLATQNGDLERAALETES